VLNNERTSKRSPRTTVALLGNTESPVVIMYMMILDIDEFTRRIAYGKGVGGTVMSIAGMVSIRLAALDIDMTAITPCSAMLGPLDDDANTHKGSTSATVIATLAAINVLKERRRRRFVVVVGAPRRDAYKGTVHEDEKTNAVEVIPCQRTPGLCP
jgi:hypothetical protein